MSDPRRSLPSSSHKDAWPTEAPRTDRFVEEIEIRGHIIDSLILPKILDLITAGGGTFQIKQITIGQARYDPSYALVEVRAPAAPNCWRHSGARSPTTGPCRPRSTIATGAGRHRRRVSRRILQHDQPADRSPAGRPLDRRRRSGNGLRHRRSMPIGTRGPLHGR